MKTNKIIKIHCDLFVSVNCFLSKICRDLDRFLNNTYSLEHRTEHIQKVNPLKGFQKTIKPNTPMNMINKTLPMAMLFLFATGCQNQEEIQSPEPTESIGQNKIPRSLYERKSNGKIKFAKLQSEVLSESSLDSLDFPEFDDKLVNALESQLKVLRLRKQRKNQSIAGVDISIEKLESTIDILLQNIQEGKDHYGKNLTAYQTWGKDKKGHVKYTGYFTPEISVKKNRDSIYKYPIYKKPSEWEGTLPSRAEIDGEGAFEGFDLELAYAKDLVDIYYMQVQGSGYVRFKETGKKVLFRFGGGNRMKYRSIENYILKNDHIEVKRLTLDGIKKYLNANPHQMEEVLFANPSYTFFKPSKSSVKGAGGVRLVEGVSIAVDTKYFPLGSVILASVPVFNKKGKITDHEFKILLPQDTGAAINGPGHVDIYSGVGNRGKRIASAHHHYGNMWILLPKENDQLAMNY